MNEDIIIAVGTNNLVYTSRVMDNLSEPLYIDDNYDCGEVVRDIEIKLRDAGERFLPYTRSTAGKKYRGAAKHKKERKRNSIASLC